METGSPHYLLYSINHQCARSQRFPKLPQTATAESKCASSGLADWALMDWGYGRCSAVDWSAQHGITSLQGHGVRVCIERVNVTFQNKNTANIRQWAFSKKSLAHLNWCNNKWRLLRKYEDIFNAFYVDVLVWHHDMYFYYSVLWKWKPIEMFCPCWRTAQLLSQSWVMQLELFKPWTQHDWGRLISNCGLTC